MLGSSSPEFVDTRDSQPHVVSDFRRVAVKLPAHISWTTISPSSGSSPLLWISSPTAVSSSIEFNLTDGEVTGASSEQMRLLSIGNNALTVRRSTSV